MWLVRTEEKNICMNIHSVSYAITVLLHLAVKVYYVYSGVSYH